MTQKELLYFEDAIGHEKNIVKICDEMLKNMSDENLISFIENQKNEHNELKNKVLQMLEEKVNE